jgi:hypothetical protein
MGERFGENQEEEFLGSQSISLETGKEISEAVLHEKERKLLESFHDYVTIREAIEEGNGGSSELALAIGVKDPEFAKSTARKILEKSNFDNSLADVCGMALELNDVDLQKHIVEKYGYRVGKPGKVAAVLGDFETAKNTINSWGSKSYYGRDTVSEIGVLIAQKDPVAAKEMMEKNLGLSQDPDKMGSYDDLRIIQNMTVEMAKSDPDTARGIMKNYLGSKYFYQVAGHIAVGLGDTETAKMVAEKCLTGYSTHPRDAAEIALALGDKDLMKRSFENAKRSGPKTAGEIAVKFGDLEMAKKAIEDCLVIREERRKAGKYDANSSDDGQSYEKAAAKLMVDVVKEDASYGKELVEKYFLNLDQKKTTFSMLENGVPFDVIRPVATILADKDPGVARTIATRFYEAGWKSTGDAIVAEIFKSNINRLKVSPEEGVSLLSSGKDTVALAVGWFLKPEDLQKTLGEVGNENIRRTALLGGIFSKEPAAYQRELADIAFSSPAAPSFERNLARCLVYFDYEQVSSIMLQKVKDAKDEKVLARYLKTLIEIENPKGRTIATDLFTNRDMQPRLREYVARKLIDEKHWDPALGSILQERTKEGKKQEVDDTLVAMIKDLGLTPDKSGYEALEKPGLLEGASLQERVQELKSLRQEFSQLPLEQLKERLKDDRIRQIFYLVKGGEYRYTLINDYSYQKFSLVVGKILEQEVDEGKMKEFEKSLESANISAEQRTTIIQSLKEGRFPFANPEQRSFSFETSVELGSEYEIAFQRLQEVWGRELKVLAVVNDQAGELPLGIDDALANFEGKDAEKPKTKKVLELLKTGEKQDYQSVKKIAELCKKELISSLKQRGKQVEDKKNINDRMAELERLNTSGILHAFLSERLPQLKDSSILSEWESHLRETLSTLETGPVKGGSKNKRLELTFLDKGRDFVRSVRFADGRQCCFNSTNYGGEAGAVGGADWIARLHADPLSFIIDVKEEGSRIVSGFVFGRMGIDPETKRPIPMLNGIYSQESGGAVANNILKSIEERFAKTIGASSIVIASKYGGTLSQKPTGYENIQKEIQAIRALKHNEKVYDDIGTVPNGTFTFSGYERQLL